MEEKQITVDGTIYGLEGTCRLPCQTPFEFQDELGKASFAKYTAVKIVTESFCLVKYGRQKLDYNLRLSTTNALAEL